VFGDVGQGDARSRTWGSEIIDVKMGTSELEIGNTCYVAKKREKKTEKADFFQ